MARTSFASIDDIEADPKIHARTFHHPARKPTNFAYLGDDVAVAQWYTPAEDGILDANSAIQAATIQ
jgi:hypothetical protein